MNALLNRCSRKDIAFIIEQDSDWSNLYRCFPLKGIIQICEKALETSNRIIDLREKNLQKMSCLGRASKNALVLLRHLYKSPIVNVKKVEVATGLSREAANRLVRRFCEEGILSQKDQNVKYGRLFIYQEYLNLFE